MDAIQKASQTWGGKRNPGALNGRTKQKTKQNKTKKNKTKQNKQKNKNKQLKPKMTIYISIYSY